MKKTPLQRVKNPQGRLDWLAAKLLEYAVCRKQDPLLSAVYTEVRDPLERTLRRTLGPRNHQFRDVQKYVIEGHKIIEQIAQRRVA